ncbi:MAG: uracil-DNA glycosylase family protein [Anderseniella sp.]|nr:uracil-DNA glycosylase family protein [Anderseniella sp.]
MSNSLNVLLSQIRKCRVCRDTPKTGKLPLPHEPRPVLQVSSVARVMIVGQAPGTRVHASGQPFTDPSGDRLRDWMGITEEVFYDPDKLTIVPMGFCFPGLNAKGGDLPPRAECAPLWREALMQAMPQVTLVLAIGMYAQKWHMGRQQKPTLTETVRNWRQYHEMNPVSVIPMPHPSWRNSGWLKKNPWFEAELLPVLKADVKALVS